MNKQEIIRMARESGVFEMSYPHPGNMVEVERFAALVAAAEREACASICFQEGPSIDGELIAAAIRARGNGEIVIAASGWITEGDDCVKFINGR